MTPNIIGLFVIGVPALLLAYLVLWKRHRPVFFFALALIAVGLGYLYTTGATADIADAVLGGYLGAPVPAQ